MYWRQWALQPSLCARMLLRSCCQNVLQPRKKTCVVECCVVRLCFVLAVKRGAWHWPPCSYHRACPRCRTVWFSEEFLHLRPKLARVVLTRTGASSHRWSVVTDRETFAQRAKGNKRAKTMFLSFVSKQQLRDEDAQSAKLLPANMALSFLADMDRCKTSTGMCAK